MMNFMTRTDTKDFYDISWKVTEEQYRADSALSYSTLATFERGGFGELRHLFDRKESPSLTLGSAVDAIITGGADEFNERFLVIDLPQLSDNLQMIVKQLFATYSKIYNSFDSIPDDIISDVAKQNGFWAKDIWDHRRANEVRKNEGCEAYYNMLYDAEGKTLLSLDTYKDVKNMVNALKTKPATKEYFADNKNDGIKRYYQLKFKSTLGGINYRCMADLIIVNTDKKLVTPIDLKTSSKPEYDFYKSFIDWSYSIQARLYYRIIRDNMNRDPYFKDFELANYKFIVVNKYNLDPLVWNFPKTKFVGTLNFNNNIIMRDPEDIGRELHHYLTNNSMRPLNIENENDLCEWLNK